MPRDDEPPADLSRIRNFGIVAHIDAGKTTVSERILFYTGKEHAMGEVHEGSAKMDYLAEEQERGITITAAATTIKWRGYTLHLIDTPGHVDFTAEVERSLRVLDGAVVVFDGVSGVEAQSETVWHQATHYGVPRVCFVNKMDRGGADFDRACESIEQRLGAKIAPVTVPIGAGDAFEGVIDLLTREALRFRGEQGEHVVREAVPAALLDEMEVRRSDLVEAVADVSDEVAALYLDGEDVPAEALRAGLRQGTLSAALFPVLSGAALRNQGIQPLLDAVVDLLPSPDEVGAVTGVHPDRQDRRESRKPDPDEPLCALAFKIFTDPHGDLTFVRIYSGRFKQGQGLYNSRLKRHERAMRILHMHANERQALPEASAGDIVALVGPKQTATGDTLCEKGHPIALESITFPQPVITMAIEPRSAADRDRLEEALARLSREDPTFHTAIHEETGQTIIAGMGELHLEVLKNRLLRDFGIQANVGAPRVSYRQTVRGPGEAAHTFQRIIQGKEQVATVEVAVGPREAGSGVAFTNEAPREAVPKRFLPSVEEGVIFAAQGGLDLGFPVIDVDIRLRGGHAHETDSTDVAFSAAASEAFREACEKAGLVILEPVMRFEVTTPAEFVGPIQSDLARRGAVVEGDELKAGVRVIRGTVALSNMFGYSTTVRSLSQGRAGYSMEPAGFAEVPPDVARRLSFPLEA
ncbi:MAG: elongation factor G [Planctomycetota bacterium]|jgi:elongation factor G